MSKQTAAASKIDCSGQREALMMSMELGESGWLLSQAFGTTPEFWLNLQSAHDLATNRPRRSITRLKRAS